MNLQKNILNSPLKVPVFLKIFMNVLTLFFVYNLCLHLHGTIQNSDFRNTTICNNIESLQKHPSTNIQKNSLKRIINKRNFWTQQMSIILKKSNFNKINNKYNILYPKKIITLNCIGGKLDSYILKEYMRETFFDFSSNILGGGVMTRINCEYLNLYDHYVIIEKSPGVFMFIKNISSTIKVFKTYKFSRNSNLIKLSLKVINQTNKSINIDIDIIFNFTCYQIENNQSFDLIWEKDSELVIRNNQIINMFTLSNKTDYFVKKYVQKLSYFAINHKYFVFLVSVIKKDEINCYKITNLNSVYLTPNGISSRLINIILSVKAVYIPSHSIKKIKLDIYVGPKQIKYLNKSNTYVLENINTAWFSSISKPMLWLLTMINGAVSNFGISIVILTLLIKIVTFPLTQKSMISLYKTKKLSPEIKFLKNKYAHDKTLFNQKQMELYQKHDVNPITGCLPMVIQMPIWIGLYRMLLNSIELYQQPFIFWINDLTMPDSYYIFPVMMGLSMCVQNFFQNHNDDQEYMKYVKWFLPFFLTGIMIQLPSGLSIYIFTNNILTIIQQIYIKKTYENS